MAARQGFLDALPAGGLKAALTGGNTIGGTIREIRPRSDGYRHIDTPALIGRLRELGVNSYFYGVWDSPTDWDDLRHEFLPAAAEHGILVVPYLAPPSETRLDGRASRPYVMDYVAWAKANAELSLEFPNLIAWSIDDFQFDENAKLFTHAYMTRMKDAQDAINPALGFLTCAYWDAATDDDFLDTYGPFIDGIVYPFLDAEAHNTQVASTVKPDLDAILAKTRPRGLETILLVYAGRFLTAQLRPTEDYAARAIRAGIEYGAEGRIAGTVAYGTQVDGAPTPPAENVALVGDGRLSLAVPHITRVPAGRYAEASQVVRLDPDSPRYELSFWHLRRFAAKGPDRGDYALRVLVDGDEVFCADVCAEWVALWIQGHGLQGPIDLTERLRGMSEATIAFRLTAEREVVNTYVDVGIDHLETIGFELSDPGFETGDGWTLTPERGPILAAIDRYVPDRPERIFAAVAGEFRRSV